MRQCQKCGMTEPSIGHDCSIYLHNAAFNDGLEAAAKECDRKAQALHESAERCSPRHDAQKLELQDQAEAFHAMAADIRALAKGR